MRTTLLILCLISVPTLFGCSSVNWEHDYQNGLAKASQLRRRALVQVHSNISPECREMEEVFSDPDVQQLMQNFVPIRLDTVMHRGIVEQLGIQAVPTFLIIRPDLTVAGSHAGALSAEKFRIFLIRHTYD